MIDYLVPTSRINRRFWAPGKELNTGVYAPYPVTIRNARLAGPFTLDAHGFCLGQHHTDITDWPANYGAESAYAAQVAQVAMLAPERKETVLGMDLKEYFRESEALGLKGVRDSQREAYAWWRRLRWYQKVTIAMVNGWCFGGAYGPLYACDLAICAEEAQFGLSEVNWGILPGGGATKVVVDLMPMRDAMPQKYQCEVGVSGVMKSTTMLEALTSGGAS